MAVIMHARFYQMIGAKHARRQNRWLVAANQNLHRMLDVHLVPHSMYRALGDDIPVVEQDYPVGHHVHFVQDVTGNNQVQALRSQLFEERDRSARPIGSSPLSGSSRISTEG